MKEPILLQILKDKLNEKYDFKTGNIVKDVTNCINILFEEIQLMYEAENSLQESIDLIEVITEDNTSNLCPTCAELENSRYDTLDNILQTGLTELNKISKDKTVNFYCIATFMLKSEIPEIENLFNFTPEEINSLPEEILMLVVETATERLLQKSLNTEKYLDFFSYIVGFLNEELFEAL